MTKLEAINEILAAIGEPPVETLPSGVPDADLAEQHLDRINERLQDRGWWFNQETVTLEPDELGNITWPSNALRLKANDHRKLVKANGLIYDLSSQALRFDQPVTVDVTWMIPWDDLPVVFQSYLAVKTARKFQVNSLGSAKLHQMTAEDEAATWAELMAEDLRNSRPNMMRDSVSGQRIVNRHVNPSKYF